MKTYGEKTITNKHKSINNPVCRRQATKPNQMNETTLQKMKHLKFFGMLRSFRTTIEAGQMNRYTPDEMVGFLVESEWDDRQNRKIERGLKNAKFRYKAGIEGIIYNTKRNLEKNDVHRLADCT